MDRPNKYRRYLYDLAAKRDWVGLLERLKYYDSLANFLNFYKVPRDVVRDAKDFMNSAGYTYDSRRRIYLGGNPRRISSKPLNLDAKTLRARQPRK